MAKIMDKGQSKFVRYGSYICVWEVYTTEVDIYSDEVYETRQAAFYDPNKAMQWAIDHYGVNAQVHASLFKPEWCE